MSRRVNAQRHVNQFRKTVDHHRSGGLLRPGTVLVSLAVDSNGLNWGIPPPPYIVLIGKSRGHFICCIYISYLHLASLTSMMLHQISSKFTCHVGQMSISLKDNLNIININQHVPLYSIDMERSKKHHWSSTLPHKTNEQLVGNRVRLFEDPFFMHWYFATKSLMLHFRIFRLCPLPPLI